VRERTVQVGDTTVFVREWGRARSAPLLFWHALGDHTGLQIGEVAPLLAEHRLRVVAVDAPGFGNSERLPRPQDYRLNRLAGFAASLLNALGLDRARWLGASWGAAVGAHTAAAYPRRVSALALLDGGYYDLSAPRQPLGGLRAHWRQQAGFRYQSWDELFAEGAEYFGRWSEALELATRSAFDERRCEIWSQMGPDLYAEVIWAMLSPPQSKAWAGLAAARVPVLLSATEPPHEERDAAREHFHDAVPQAEVLPLPGRHHWLLEEAPEEVARLVGQWLTSGTR
jgi:pimeloyl-ACP methyl ester carboxylesterase